MMKHLNLLIAFFLFLGVTLQAQSTTTVEKNSKRITITTTKTDEQGKAVTETWIAEGDQPETILQHMAVNPDILQKADAEKLASTNDGEQLFIIRSAGDKAVVEGRLQDVEANKVEVEDGNKKVIVWSKSSDSGNHEYKMAQWYGKSGGTDGYGYEDRKSNCAALGIYVNTTADKTGCSISSLIDQGGAKEAGLTRGGVIIKKGDYVITDFPSLYDALTHYLPGDDVMVNYNHEGKSAKVNVHLKSWADMPGQEWRARGDCGKVEDFKPEVVKPQLENEPTTSGPVSVEPLKLDDARMYPNPTPGTFALSFTTAPGPVTISVTDVNGKIIYSENNVNATGYYNHDIDLKNASPGNYVVTVKQGDKVFTQQLSKQ